LREKIKEEKTKEFRLHERIEREFERRFVLPRQADTEHVKAVFSKGVLAVHAPKVPAAKAKHVAITEG
jgi:HSP20 family molecular chaperone IbpA